MGDEREFYVVRSVRELFRIHGNVSGEITWEDFEGLLGEQQMQDYFKAIDVDLSEAKSVFDLLDLDHSGSLDAYEFLDGCLRLRGKAKALDSALIMHELRQVSSRFDAHFEYIEGNFV